MGQIIIHHDGAFNFYSTVSDSAVLTSSLTEEQVTTLIREQYGSVGAHALANRFARAKLEGTSSMLDHSLSKQLSCNRAGPGDSRMPVHDFIHKFLTLGEPKCSLD